MTVNKIDLLLNAEKIELVKVGNVKGFKREDVTKIVNELIKAYNGINSDNYGEDFTICINNFKLTTTRQKSYILNCLTRFKAIVKDSEIIENKSIIETIKSISHLQLYKTKDNFITDGRMAINAEYVGNIPENENLKDCNDFIKNVCNNELINLKDYKTAKKAGIFIFYKDLKNYITFDNEYIKILPKDCELYKSKSKHIGHVLLAVKDKKLIAVIAEKSGNIEEIKKDFPYIPTETSMGKDEIFKMSNIVELSTVTDDKRHFNPVTNRYYHGNNANELEKAFLKNNYTCTLWVARNQAKKLNKQVKANAHGVVIKVFYTDDEGRTFCKLENIYNVAELEELKKIETTNDYKNMIERLKAV